MPKAISINAELVRSQSLFCFFPSMAPVATVPSRLYTSPNATHV